MVPANAPSARLMCFYVHFVYFFTVLKSSFLAEVPREPLVVGGLHTQPSIVLPAIVASASQSPTGIFFNGQVVSLTNECHSCG